MLTTLCCWQVGLIAVDYQKSLHSGNVDKDSANYLQLKSEVHQRSAEKLLKLCCINGGTFVKIGQHLGSLEYLLPPEYVKTLQVLHSKAPKSDIESVKSVLRQELHADPDELFTSFSAEPVGAASLAQVHVATTQDGRKVAVKVQHRTVKEHAAIDMKGMEFLVSAVSYFFPDFNFDWLVEETKINLPLELDFEHEGRNAEQVAEMFKQFPWLKVPSIDWTLSTKRVLTMEYCEGGQVNDPVYMKAHNLAPEQVAERLGLLYSEMIFCRGYVHSDPHPGNVLVNRRPRGDAQIILLDHGLYARVSDNIRESYSKFWLAILGQDVDGIAKYGRELGVGDLAGLFACMVTARSWDSITRGIDKHSINDAERNEVSNYATKLLPEIIATLGRVNRQMLLLLKTNDLLRGIEYSLNIQHSRKSFLTMSRCCVRAVYDRQMLLCSSSFCRLLTSVNLRAALLRIDVYTSYISCMTNIHKLFAWSRQSTVAEAFRWVSEVPGLRLPFAASTWLFCQAWLCVGVLKNAFVTVVFFGRQRPNYLHTSFDENGRVVFKESRTLKDGHA
ncbi:aarF domain-containing protein kinase 1 isoform X2 [Hyalella azteca]|uniref:AarF domain-containing protein kinase 1 isoform X2 n=1 Tax=Hyalella azteca TaxID=294128 RepID=A0A8B7PLX1_HYAAZ|nr:aarF domain-containing protein kinase 1 isoform X2 [Hyalella azteca]